MTLLLLLLLLLLLVVVVAVFGGFRGPAMYGPGRRVVEEVYEDRPVVRDAPVVREAPVVGEEVVEEDVPATPTRRRRIVEY